MFVDLKSRIVVRPLESNDIKEYLSLSLSDEQHSMANIPEMGELLNMLLPDEEDLQSGFDTELKVFANEENLVGFAAYKHEGDTTTYEILYFLIDQRWQGQGYGTAAMGQLLAELWANEDCSAVKIRYMDHNLDARAFYAKFGFVEVSNEDGFVEAMLYPQKERLGQPPTPDSPDPPKPTEEADQAYALASPEERARRATLSDASHMKPLSDYLTHVREQQGEGYDLPAFDPCDGGIHARALFLLEAPGPKAVGSAFISRNNPDPTARNFCELLAESGIPRQDTLIWNIVPWYVGDGQGRIRAVTRQDIAEALPHLNGLLALLPNLQVIALVGQKAQSAATDIRARTHLPFVTMPHPSARVFNVWPKKREEARAALRSIARQLDGHSAGN